MKFYQLIFFAIALVFLSACSNKKQSPADYVNPFIGTGGHGHTYPGATVPFGMVQLSPDNRTDGWDWCSGYHFSDSSIIGFSHTHLSGTGVGDYGDILFMPTVGELQTQPGSLENPDEGYRSRFSHEAEQAQAGYYSVVLSDYEVKAELTTTKRVGFHRYTFPESPKANIIIDLVHGIQDQPRELSIEIISDTEIAGKRRSKGWANDQHLFFYAKFSKPFQRFGVVTDGEAQTGEKTAQGKDIKAFVGYETAKDEEILVKVGISAVSIEGAKKNMETEAPHWDFDKVRQDAKQAWNEELSKISVEGGTEEQKTVFYTALYHTTTAPNLFMDTDGSYRGHDLQVHQAKDFNIYTVFSLWDTFRATHPLYTITDTEKVRDFIRTFLLQYEQGGRLPVWELAANETDCMIGYHSISVIADAYMKGIRDFDTEKALDAMTHSAELDHFGLKSYKAKAYIPVSEEAESVSKTLEYAYDDWCIATMAKEMGNTEVYERYIKRAQSYKNIYDASTGFMRGKMNETWFTPFDPKEVNFNYTEANSWQYSFFAPQDIQGLIELMGGKQAFEEKIDRLFTEDSQTTGRHQSDITGLIGQYAHGNEPSHHMAYLYNYVGKPWKTQERVRQILAGQYSARHDGLAGNEDCGQMSAWYVLSAMGFYAVTPGIPVYTIGSPIFEKVTINLESGKTFVVKANNVSQNNKYIQSATLNGKNHTKSYIAHSDIMAGGELVFEMGSQPNKDWGSAEKDIPPSAITEHLIQPVPFVEKGNRTFTGKTEVALNCITPGAKIYYTTDGTEPTADSPVFEAPLTIEETTIVKAFAENQQGTKSHPIEAKFTKIPEGRSIELQAEYSPQYSAGGDKALIDYIRGPKNFRTGSWQGYQGQDLVAIVDLGKTQRISNVALGCLQDENSWIFLPQSVEFFVSTDGENFRPVAQIPNEIAPKTGGVILKEFSATPNTQARYVKVVAKSLGTCPEWHVGAGEKAWLFADELVIE